MVLGTSLNAKESEEAEVSKDEQDPTNYLNVLENVSSRKFENLMQQENYIFHVL